MSSKPSIPKGTRDFSPVEMQRRNYIFDTIRSVFILYGYQPIETPALENLTTLLGKYGDEGDKLLYRILNSGDFLSGIDTGELQSIDSQRLASRICDRGLRYDLTVPFARYVVQHRNDITFPFRRYQIQPVWRADRPQKGRYREFFQCDADVIGSDSLINEQELILIIREVFGRLRVGHEIRVNNRKILSGIAEVAGVAGQITEITTEIDKIEKIGFDTVMDNLRAMGISGVALEKISPLITLSGTVDEKISILESSLGESETGMTGVEEVRELFSFFSEDERDGLVLDLTLARGLNYYTGAIIEVKSTDSAIGSICGGGRYDDLTGIFGLPGVSGVGISFGADRIYDVMLQHKLFPETPESGTKILVVNFGGEELNYSLGIVASLRKAGINSILYPEPARMKKQFGYADALMIPRVVIAGEEEIAAGELTLKEMESGDQMRMRVDQLIEMYEKTF